MNKEIDNGNYITFSNLLKYDEIGALYTKKPYDFNFHKIIMDEIKSVGVKELEKEIGEEFNSVVIPLQEHTDNIAIIDNDNVNDTFSNTDGAITNLRNVALFSVSADCENIMLYDPVNKVIGCIHSGWKGTCKRIVEKAINIMVSNYNSNVSDIELVITPSIQQCCFEVEKDVYDIFLESFKDIDISDNVILKNINGVSKYYIDTISIQRKLLLKLGVLESHMLLSDVCVKCNSLEYHSYRNDSNCGRNAAVIWMR